MSAFILLQLKLKWGFNRNNDKKSAVMTALASLLAVVVALALVLVLTFVLRTSMRVNAKKLSQLYITIVMIGLTVVATGMQMRRLYRPGDMLITARFPLTPFKLFLSYIILNYIDLCIYGTVLFLPIMITFGVAMQCITATYVAGVILGTILLPMIPFALSVFIAIPLVYINAQLEKHGAVRLVLFVLFLVGCFVLYNYVLSVLADFFINKNWGAGTLHIWNRLLSGLDAYYNPAYFLANVIFFEDVWKSIGIIVGVSAAVAAAGIALAAGVSSNIKRNALEGGEGGYKKRSRIDGHGSGFAILRYTFREILRTKTYSYFYLGVAISTPVMVFLCNRLVMKVGEAQMGAGINFGASMIVVSAFMAMICSFTGTVLSVEGKNFYITKLVPVSYRKQLLIKAFANVCVSAVALAISAAVLGALKFLDPIQLAALVGTQFILSVGLVFNGINLNLANPNLKPKANGETEEINITYMLLIGLAIAAVIGACSIIIPRAVENGEFIAEIVCLCIVAAFAAVGVIVFLCTAERKYREIEA